MDYKELEKAKESFGIQSIRQSVENIIRLRDEFTSYFTRSKIASMTIDEYVIGLQNMDGFCYKLERTLHPLGSIAGQPSTKFGVWYSPTKKQYCFEKRFGDNYKVAFERLRIALLQLLKDGDAEDYEAIKNNPINSLVKGKILAVYFPNKYMNVYSNRHLNHYLTFFELNNEELMASNALYKREVLVKFKNEDKDMREWSNYEFSIFLWSHYPKDIIP